jgi:hypothetical protein
LALSNDSIRFVTHSDLSTDDIDYAIGQICQCLAASATSEQAAFDHLAQIGTCNKRKSRN